jgi:hypothetical protein
MDFDKFVEWAFMAIIGGGVAWSASFLSKISSSITQLNTRLATVLERTAWLGKEVENLDNRIVHLERNKSQD